MSDLFDLESTIQAIETADGLVASKGLPPNQNVFDTGDRNGRFEGDLPGGATISGNDSVVVEGSINGSKGNPLSDPHRGRSGGHRQGPTR